MVELRATQEFREKERERCKRYREKHLKETRASSLAWRRRNRERANAISRAWSRRPEVRERRRTPEARAKSALSATKWQAANPERRKETRLRHYRELKRKVIELYGGKCARCPEARPECLTTDHIHGGGNQDRRARGCKGGGMNWYLYLIRERPKGIQLLCYNCHHLKDKRGPRQSRFLKGVK